MFAIDPQLLIKMQLMRRRPRSAEPSLPRTRTATTRKRKRRRRTTRMTVVTMMARMTMRAMRSKSRLHASVGV